MLESESAYELYINHFLSLQFATDNNTKPSGPSASSNNTGGVQTVDISTSTTTTNSSTTTPNSNSSHTNVPSWVVDALTYAGVKVYNVN